MTKYFITNNTQWNDVCIYVEAENKEKALEKVLKLYPYGTIKINDIEEITSDCQVLMDIDNPEYEG